MSVKPIDVDKVRRGAVEALDLGATIAAAGGNYFAVGMVVITLAEQLRDALDALVEARGSVASVAHLAYGEEHACSLATERGLERDAYRAEVTALKVRVEQARGHLLGWETSPESTQHEHVFSALDVLGAYDSTIAEVWRQVAADCPGARKGSDLTATEQLQIRLQFSARTFTSILDAHWRRLEGVR